MTKLMNPNDLQPGSISEGNTILFVGEVTLSHLSDDVWYLCLSKENSWWTDSIHNLYDDVVKGTYRADIYLKKYTEGINNLGLTEFNIKEQGYKHIGWLSFDEVQRVLREERYLNFDEILQRLPYKS